jgi:hypothetical protein
LLFAVRVYQSFFSALMPCACKFYPSCSHYAAEALRLHGARRGSWLAFRRVLRCHPFSRGGVDLVPDPADAARTHTPADVTAPVVIPSEARSGFRTPVESTGLLKPENLSSPEVKEQRGSSASSAPPPRNDSASCVRAASDVHATEVRS